MLLVCNAQYSDGNAFYVESVILMLSLFSCLVDSQDFAPLEEDVSILKTM